MCGLSLGCNAEYWRLLVAIPPLFSLLSLLLSLWLGGNYSVLVSAVSDGAKWALNGHCEQG